MKKIFLSFLSVCILVCANMVGLIMISPEGRLNVSAKTIIVDDNGTPGVDCNYTTIQEAINAADPGDTVFVKNGIYYENLNIDKTINLTGEDKDTTVIDGFSSNVIEIHANWVNITGFTTTTGWHGIYIDSSFGNNTLIGNKISNNILNGIYLYFSSGYNTIAYNNILYNGDNGIESYQSLGNNIISGNNITLSDWDGIWIDFTASDNTIINNNISNNRFGISISGQNDTIIGNNVSNNSRGLSMSSSYSNITGNDIYNNTRGLYFSLSSNNTIIDNNISNNDYGIWLDETINTIITNNNFANDGIFIEGTELSHYNTHNISTDNIVNGKTLYYFKNVNDIDIDDISIGQLIIVNCTNMIANNLMINSTDIGIEIAYSLNISIINNVISNNDWHGIYLDLSSSSIIKSNNISSNMGYGVRLTRTSYSNTIKANKIILNGGGINLRGLSHSNIIENNNISLNIGDGFYLYTSSKNTIAHNIISNNNNGLYLWEANNNNIITQNKITSNINTGISIITPNNPNNRIYHNNFIDNPTQAEDGTNNKNYWDNNYPQGGNHWSNYIGVDNFKGLNQDQVGSDGIGDTTYIIDADSQDNYPLMNPFENYTFLHEGWNLVSIPFIQSDTNLSNALSSISGSYDTVWSYKTNDKQNYWKLNNTSKPSSLNDFDEVDHTIGFWIHITEPGGVLFEYPGTQPTQNQSITLYPGWNMVGYPSQKSYNRTDGLNNLTFGMHVNSIWTYNAVIQRWDEIGPSDYFEIGKGYWIHAKSKCVWEVPI